jgi:hypothetical protein
MELTDSEKALVDFERSWWLESGGEPKSAAIRRCLEMSPSTYRSTLERLIDSPEAFAYDPLLVRRLRRRRDDKRRASVIGEAPRWQRPH